jgi:acyl-CoA thioester hydrolase
VLSVTGDGLSQFFWPVRVYYEDTDSGGVVYYANYLKFMERARTEYLRSLGFEQDRLRMEKGVLFAVHSLKVNYRRPARFNDTLDISAEISDIRRTSLTFTQRVLQRDGRDLLCEGQVRIACVEDRSFKPAPIPETIRSELLNAS